MGRPSAMNELENAAFAIAHVAGCDEPNSNARLCDIAFQIEHGWDGCECVNMARAALVAAREAEGG